MSINWVMLGGSDFVKLPGEQKLHASPARTCLSVQSLSKQQSREQFSISSSGGRVYLTNQRIVYIPSTPSATLQSFAAPIKNFYDTHVTAPWFGPNVWVAIVQPVVNGGIPSYHAAVELKLTFNDGGAYDFHTKFVQVKERVAQLAAVAAESGQSRADPSAVHLDQLPAYEEHQSTVAAQQPEQSQPTTLATGEDRLSHSVTNQSGQSLQEPIEPPPDYEVVQRDSVAESLERGLRLRHT